ncbi:hypothetical protein Lal_00020398 [Lupinus albus]|nr:hypothetical protein Lal_00020398 [Lupinus albus]
MSDPENTPATPSEPVSFAEPPQSNHDQYPTTTSFSIWPPTQRTRDAVINRLIQTLSTPSVLSKRYGTLSSDESSAAARQIEDEAFTTASAASEEDGIEILQVYSKEISKRMLDIVKAKATAPSSAVDNGVSASDAPPSSSPAEEPVTAAAELLMMDSSVSALFSSGAFDGIIIKSNSDEKEVMSAQTWNWKPTSTPKKILTW